MQSFSPDEIDEFLRHGTSTLCEAAALPCALDHALRPVWPGAALAGTAFPLRCAPGDNLAIHYAVARGVGMRGCVKLHAPSVGETIVIAGVTVARGDLVVADADGVLSIPRTQVARTLAAARQRTDKEASMMQRLAQGETTLQILGLADRGHGRKS